MIRERFILLLISTGLFLLSACGGGFQVKVTTDEMNPDIIYTTTSYMTLKKGDPLDEGTIKIKLQDIYNKKEDTKQIRMHVVYQGNTWTNVEYVQMVASYSTYDLRPEKAPDRKRMEEFTVEESFWVDVENKVFLKVWNSERWKVVLHSKERRFELELTEDEIAEMEEWYRKKVEVHKEEN